MNFLAEPPTAQREKRQKRRVGQPAIWKDDSSRRAVQVSVLATLLVHLLLFVAVPRMFKPDPARGLLDRVPREQTFNIDLAPEEDPQPTPPPKPPSMTVKWCRPWPSACWAGWRRMTSSHRQPGKSLWPAVS